MRFKITLNMLHLPLAARVAVMVLLAGSANAVGQEAVSNASIDFETTTHDFGPVSDTQTYRTTFAFGNVGEDVLEIIDVKASCGCTTPALPKKRFVAGERSEIEVQFKPKGGGTQSKNITIYTNDPKQPMVILTIEADVTQFLPTEPRIARFNNVAKGTPSSTDVQLKPRDPEAVIERVSMSGLAARWFKATIVPSAEGDIGSSRLVRIQLLPDAPWGQHYATANIVVTGRPSPDTELVTHAARVTVSAKIVGTLRSNATMFRVSTVLPGESFTKVVKLDRPDGKPFQVLSTVLSGSTVEGMTVKAVPIAAENGGGYSIVLVGTPTESEQRIGGVVKIYTDVPGEEELSLRVSGIARARP
ncbi:MAG: DUF1573 domain-containing protein [Phycisphaerales bacterium]|nr:DUF1573 domain-containing protein [Phycisphaerales bacterium]